MSLISDGSYRVLYFVHGQAAVILFLLSAERHRPREEIGPRTVTLEEAPAVLALLLGVLPSLRLAGGLQLRAGVNDLRHQ